MKSLIIFSTLLVVVICRPDHVSVTEDTLGNYKFAFETADQSKAEERTQDGFVKGHYVFVDTDGNHHKLEYKSGAEHGFIASSADIPMPVPEMPENPDVVKARNEHMAIWQATVEANGLWEEEKHARQAGGVRVIPGHTQTVKVLVPVIEYVHA